MFIEKHWIFDEYRKVFRNYTPSIFVQEQMLGLITDRGAWAQTCFYWGMNDYKPSSVGKMLDYYEQQLAERQKSRVGQSVAGYETYDCSNCFDLKIVQVPKTGGQFDWEMEDAPCPKCATVKV